MKNYFLLTILAFIILCSNNFLLSMERLAFSENKKENFMIKRFARKFNLKEICAKYPEEALNLYNIAFDKFREIQAKVPQEVYEKIIAHRNTNFVKFYPVKSKLVDICARAISIMNLRNLNKQKQAFVFFLKTVSFFVHHVHSWYDTKLAELILNIFFNPNYKPSQKQLDRSLCMASHLGDSKAVEFLLKKGANPNFVTENNYNYTPLAYALVQEHKFSKRKQKPININFVIRNYERTVKMLIKAGAKIDHKVKNKLFGFPSLETYIFFQTCNVKIFGLFEDQTASKVELIDDSGCNFVMNAFKIGNAQFIKKLYANPLYRNSRVARTHENGDPRSFMDLAILFYKRYDFKELYAFLIENNEHPLFEEHCTLEEFELQCLDNAMEDLDFESIKNLYQEGISVNNIYQSDNSTDLINCIKKANSKTSPENLVQIMELFIQAGVNFSHEDITGKTALDYAKKRKLDPTIIQALIMTPLLYHLKANIVNELELLGLIHEILIENDSAIFNYRDSKGKTALEYAQASNQDKSVIEVLKACIATNL